MTLRDLKLKIKAQDVPDAFFIFECSDNFFLATKYAEAICEIKQLEKTVVDTIFTQDSAISLVMGFENNLRVIYVDTFSEASEDYSRFTNTIVICKAVDKKISRVVSDFVIKIPAIKDWQVYDYIKSQCPGLVEQDIIDLWIASGKDLYKLQGELDKIKLFEEAQQGRVAIELILAPGSKFYAMSNFQVVDALVKHDIPTLTNFLLHTPLVGNEFLGLVSLLINKLKAILFIEHGTKSWQEIGVSEKQFYHMKNSRTGLSIQELQKKLEMLTAFDLKLKSGLLDISNKTQIDYLIIGMVS